MASQFYEDHTASDQKEPSHDDEQRTAKLVVITERAA